MNNEKINKLKYTAKKVEKESKYVKMLAKDKTTF